MLIDFLSRFSNEHLQLSVLVDARCLPDEQDVSVLWPVWWDAVVDAGAR
jgi:hypothetical protein